MARSPASQFGVLTRDLAALAADPFDLLVIGGGIHGAFAAWDAALRGLRVALVERADFASGTSANSLKVAHGGLRYLQQLDLARMRRSSVERSTLLRLAPHLVRPLPFLVGTYGLGRDGRVAFGAGFAINEAVSWDRNRHLPAHARLPVARLLGRAECLERFGGFDRAGLSGGALWYDGQILHPERLVVAILRAAAAAGATLANYTEARDLLAEHGKVTGAIVADRLGGAAFPVRARAVVNAAGPWAPDLAGPRPAPGAVRFARSLNLVVRRRFADCAVGVRSRTTNDPVCGARRFMFCCPWRGHTLVGTSYAIDAGDRRPTGLEEVVALLDEINAACPPLALTLEDVTFFHWGLTPLKDGAEPGRPTAPAERPRITDHSAEGLRGLVSAVGPKFTTARRVAERAVDAAIRATGLAARSPSTASAALAPAAEPPAGPHAPRLTEVYGSHAASVAAVCLERSGWGDGLAPDTPMRRGEVVHAVRAEMAQHLSDVVFRRTELGTAGLPSAEALAAAAGVMGDVCGWSPERERREIEQVRAAYAPLPGAVASGRVAG